jgi:hypothetical protein
MPFLRRKKGTVKQFKSGKTVSGKVAEQAAEQAARQVPLRAVQARHRAANRRSS